MATSYANFAYVGSEDGSGNFFFAARMNTDGSADTSFGDGNDGNIRTTVSGGVE